MRSQDLTMKWAGSIMSGLVIAFMLLDGGMKLVPFDVVIKATAELGYPASTTLARGLGILGLVCTALYALPRTAVLGAILLTAYMGGAAASHLRAGSPLFTHILFGVYLALLLWGGLYLRDARVRALLPLRKPAAHE
jgi:DoxX-like family